MDGETLWEFTEKLQRAFLEEAESWREQGGEGFDFRPHAWHQVVQRLLDAFVTVQSEVIEEVLVGAIQFYSHVHRQQPHSKLARRVQHFANSASARPVDLWPEASPQPSVHAKFEAEIQRRPAAHRHLPSRVVLETALGCRVHSGVVLELDLHALHEEVHGTKQSWSEAEARDFCSRLFAGQLPAERLRPAVDSSCTLRTPGAHFDDDALASALGRRFEGEEAAAWWFFAPAIFYGARQGDHEQPYFYEICPILPLSHLPFPATRGSSPESGGAIVQALHAAGALDERKQTTLLHTVAHASLLLGQYELLYFVQRVRSLERASQETLWAHEVSQLTNSADNVSEAIGAHYQRARESGEVTLSWKALRPVNRQAKEVRRSVARASKSLALSTGATQTTIEELAAFVRHECSQSRDDLELELLSLEVEVAADAKLRLNVGMFRYALAELIKNATLAFANASADQPRLSYALTYERAEAALVVRVREEGKDFPQEKWRSAQTEAPKPTLSSGGNGLKILRVTGKAKGLELRFVRNEPGLQEFELWFDASQVVRDEGT